ncbi:MAG: hypothetical protein LBD48_04320 [Treponema sp.]|jgi:hypothetical protein|nr:hypothetical protein [Treponema sp.]
MYSRARVIGCLFFCALLSRIAVYPLDNEETVSDSEDTGGEPVHAVVVQLPGISSTGSRAEGLYTYAVTVGPDGIISSVTDGQGVFQIQRQGNSLTITGTTENPWINNIQWDAGNVYVRAASGPYHAENNAFTQIKIQPEQYTIYDYSVMRLVKTSHNALWGRNKIAGPSVLYMNNITAQYNGDGSKLRKLVYTPKPDETGVVCYGGVDGSVPYDLPAAIRTNGIRLYSNDTAINVINAFILEAVDEQLKNALLPLVFLEAPFANNGWVYNASSFFIDGDTLYSPSNLGKADGLPWTSANGQGIGDRITIDLGVTPAKKIQFINGYVSKEQPELYMVNSRVKQIKITKVDDNRSKIVNVRDERTPQIIDISDLRARENTILRIEILSVYPGAKYKDLCIQAIMPAAE